MTASQGSVRISTYPPSTELPAAFLDLYEESFSPEIRVDVATLEDDIARGVRELILASDGSDGGLVGFAATREIHASDQRLFSYLAVDPLVRRRGIGRSLVETVIESALAAGLGGLLLEVEPAPAGDSQFGEALVAFYGSCGAVTLAGAESYWVPAMGKGDHVPMRLMWIPVLACSPPSVVRVIEDIRREVYSDPFHA